MKKILKTVADALYSFVFCVGVVTISSYAFSYQPFAAQVTLIISASICGCVFLWMVAVKPFLEGLKTEPNQAPEPTPTAVTPPAGQEARQP